jgi:gas vesicle protein
VGFILGGLSGALTALLFAPQAGEDTRALIRVKSLELREKAQIKAEEVIARAEVATADRADALARRLRERGQGAVEGLPEPAQSAGNGARCKVKKPDEISAPTAV